MVKRRSIFVAVVLLALLGVNYWYRGKPRGELRSHSGETMGSTFSVTWVENEPHPDVPEAVSALLGRITELMSTYDPKSQLSNFNRLANTEWFDVAPEVAEVLTEAQTVSDLSGGAFDVTVKPLVTAWGFGPGGAKTPPTDAQLYEATSLVGFRRLEVRQSPPALRKQIPGLQVDVNGIAPGYAVDKIAALLKVRGITNYLIDVGGELGISGEKAPGTKWKVAIEAPDSETRVADSVYELENTALATSGDYRNYYEREGKRISHTIDPRTSRPIEHNLASVTVLARTSAQADALATAVNVLGPEEGLAFASREHLSVLMLVRTASGTFERRRTGWFVSR